MPVIKIDDKEYDLDKLSDEAKQQLNNLDICDRQILHLNVQLAIAQTARAAYSRILNEAIGHQAPAFKAESLI